MKIALFAYSRQGCQTAEKISACLKEHEIQAYTMEKFCSSQFAPLQKPSVPFYGKLFQWADAMIFVSSCGIAVRQIAAHVHDKRTDPAVLCVDELGLHVIPLLSGHIGGANALALQLASQLQAEPVITTATDINEKFSVDTWAVQNHFSISSMKLAKAVSAAILEGPVPLQSDFPVTTALPNGIVAGQTGKLGITLSCRTAEPFAQTLRLVPKILHLGIGCRKETPQVNIEAAVSQVLKNFEIDPAAISCAASIDLKAKEKGLLDFCEAHGIPIQFYTAEELLAVEGSFTPSAFVKSITGVENVCERAALLGAKELLVRKTAINGVTVAVAAEKLEVHFG